MMPTTCGAPSRVAVESEQKEWFAMIFCTFFASEGSAAFARLIEVVPVGVVIGFLLPLTANFSPIFCGWLFSGRSCRTHVRVGASEGAGHEGLDAVEGFHGRADVVDAVVTVLFVFENGIIGGLNLLDSVLTPLQLGSVDLQPAVDRELPEESFLLEAERLNEFVDKLMRVFEVGDGRPRLVCTDVEDGNQILLRQ